MTEELFRDDAYLRDCQAQVVAITEQGIVLDKTVFYPEGGGQPGDRGTIGPASGNAIAINDTQKAEDGAIVHIPSGAIDDIEVGMVVNAAIDWDYRYRHMRTHTCLHLLCALIPHPVTGGSISQAKGRLDFDMAETVDKEALQLSLNQLVEANHAVSYRWISDEEMNANSDLVRTMSVAPPSGQGRVRLIDVNQVDLQPCGGTHVAATGEIGNVRIGKVEKKGRQNRRINLILE